MRETLASLRSLGRTVAIHNDYKLGTPSAPAGLVWAREVSEQTMDLLTRPWGLSHAEVEL